MSLTKPTGATLETYFQTTANTLYVITISAPGTGTSGSTGLGQGTNGANGDDGTSGTITLTW